MSKGTIVMGSSLLPSMHLSVCPSVRRHKLVSVTPPMVFKGLITFYQSYGPLSVLAILSTGVLVSATPPTVFKVF